MEIKQPKVAETTQNNPNQGQEIASLVHQVFKQNPAGARLLKSLKNLYVSDKNHAVMFPVQPQMLANFGNSVETYSGFKSGQAGVIFFLEHMIDQHEQQEAAYAQKKAQEAKVSNESKE